MDPTTTQMPMGSAAKLPLTAADLIPALKRPAAGAAPVPPAAAGLMAGPNGTPMGSQASPFPSPDAPPEAPYDVQKQPDGSAIWLSKTQPPVVIGVIPAPKLPVSLQPPKQ